MKCYHAFFAAVLTFVVMPAHIAAENPMCIEEAAKSDSFKITLDLKRNKTGHWETKMTTQMKASNSTEDVELQLEQQVFRCNGKVVFQIEGTIGENAVDNLDGKIHFNTKHGKYAVITDNGRSAYRLNPEVHDGYGILLTNRALEYDELFDIKLENKLSKWSGNSMGIGVTKHSPSEMTMPLWMREIRSGNWMMYNNEVYIDGSVAKTGYGNDLSYLQVGDRVGVMRKSDGTLHFYINGVDQGVAASNVTGNIYGVVDLIRDAASISIV